MDKTTGRLEARDYDVTSPKPESLDIGINPPWRIALIIQSVQVELIIDLERILVIGRAALDSPVQLDIDLGPFEAEKLGVSRRHLSLGREGSNVVIVDNRSSNGTILNGQKLTPNQSYVVHHGDELMLGLLKIKIAFLIHPLLR